jgi:AAA+ superfamily predicted ATPase
VVSSVRVESAASTVASSRAAWLGRVFALSARANELLRRIGDGERPIHAADSGEAPAAELIERGLATVFDGRVELSARIRRYLDGDDRLDPGLGSFVELRYPGHTHSDAHPDEARALSRLARTRIGETKSLRVHLSGPRGVGRRHLATAVAGSLGVPIVIVDLTRAPPILPDPRELLLEAWLRDAVLYVDGVESLHDAGRHADVDRILEALRRDDGITFIASERGTTLGELAPEFIAVPLDLPGAERREAVWQDALTDHGIAPDLVDVAVTAERYRLVPSQIITAATEARGRLDWALARQLPMTATSAVYASARARSSDDLAALATRVVTKIPWERLIVPTETLAQLHELHDRVAARRVVLEQWGFAGHLQNGLAPTALFYGPAGTGKSTGAAAIAHALELDLFRVNLASVVSKYVGETEKNLDRVFSAAERSNAVLLFDEADALFGKRSEVKDAHDRYANVEISYLLQRMESYDSGGAAILSTNLRGHLDEAFTRRLAFIVHFPHPDVAQREALWRTVWPPDAPVDDDIDFAQLARAFPLTGGNIKNVALAAAFAAGVETTRRRASIGLRHALHGIRREYAKMGKDMQPDELEQAWAAAASPGNR